MSLADVRREYLGQPLSETDSESDPFRQFERWFAQVRELEPDATEMTLATATRDARPSVRTVLLKGVDNRGFVFYTNYNSRKARDLAATGRRACCSTGARSSVRSASTAAPRRSAGKSPTPTSRRARSRADGASTPRGRARSSTVATRSNRDSPSRGRPTASGCRVPHGGVGIESFQTNSNSGRAVRPAARPLALRERDERIMATRAPRTLRTWVVLVFSRDRTLQVRFA